MWCRVLLFVIALTCTFQRETTADTDDVLCLVILSGLQKDDLDINLLEKLQRHNVNIDDISNRKTIEKCMLRSNSDRSKENETVTEIVPTMNEQTEEAVTQVSYNIKETIQVEDISKENENKTNLNKSEIEYNANVESRTIPSYENLVNLWITLNHTSHQNNEIKTIKDTEKGMTVQLPLFFENETKIDSQTKDLDFIHQMFETYISATKVVTTTIKPTTAIYRLQNQVDFVSQQILKILNNNNLYHDKTIFGPGSEETQSESTHKVNYNIKETVRAQGISKDNEKKTKLNTVESSIRKNTRHNPTFENFVDAWIKFNKTSHQDNKVKTTKETEKNITVKLPVTFDKETKINSQAKDLDLITRILKRYFSEKAMTTIRPIISEKQIDTVSKQIKKFLKNNHDEILVDRALEKTNKNRNAETNNLFDVKSLTRNSDLISNQMLSQKYQLNFPVPLVSHFEDLNKFEKKLGIVKTRSNPSEQMPITLNEDTNVDPQSKYIDLLKDYIAAKYVQTLPQQPTTTPKYIDIILQEIKELLENNDTNYHKDTADDVLEYSVNRDLNPYKTRYKNDQDLNTHKSVSIQNNSELRNQQQIIVPSPYETNSLQAKNNVGFQEMPITFNNKTKAECNSIELNHIFRMFETYIATKDAEKTIAVPTTQRHIDVIAQKVKEFLDDNENKYRRIMVTLAPHYNQNTKVTNVDGTDELLVKRKIDYMKELQRQANQLKMSDSLEIATKNGQHRNKVYKENKSNDNIETEIKPFTKDLIREITEKVKASVLKDLQKQMSTTLRSITKETTIKFNTTKEMIANIHSATTSLDNFKKLVQRFKKESELSPPTTTLQLDQNKIRTATNALENFIELFEQFKHAKDRIRIPNDPIHTFSQKGKANNEFHGPINVVYPTLLPLNYAYNGNNTRAVSSIFVNPYGFHINNPMVQKTRITNDIKKFQYSVDPQNNIESKMEHAIQAAVIQTDDAQVALLGIPVSKSVSPMNQNIVVTTKHSTIQFRDDLEHISKAEIKKPIYQDYTVRSHGKFDTEWDRQSDIDLGRQSDAEMKRHFNADITRYRSDTERAYGRNNRNLCGRYPIPDFKKRIDRNRLSPRSKQANLATDNFYREYLSNVRGYSGKPWHRPEYSKETKSERFHEILERPDEWQYRFKNRDAPKKDKRMNVASRQQLSINDLKKNNRYDDSHYINFLKSQQKVNDLLEKMLKPPDRVRSVEAV